MNKKVNGNGSDNGNFQNEQCVCQWHDNDIVNDDVFAVSNFSDPFYSAFKKLTQL